MNVTNAPDGRPVVGNRVVGPMAAAVCLLGVTTIGTIAGERPNIVLIMADDLGYECIGANGGTSYATPNLDQMAATGIRFEHCYAQPVCTPSRVKLMTGLSNVRNYARFGLLDRSQSTFGNVLRDAGYATCIVGKWQLGADASLPRHFGFDEHCLWHLQRRVSRYASPGVEIDGESKDFRPGYGPDVCADFACDFIDRHRDSPFLLYYPMILTHCPFEPTPDSNDWDATSDGSPTYRGKPKYFGDMVTYMDKIVGRILKQLDTSGVRDNTIVIFTGDNGTDAPVVSRLGQRDVEGGKGKTTDAGTRVPLIVQWMGRSVSGIVSDDLVDFSDFVPTLCDVANVELPRGHATDGHSFLPQVLGTPASPRPWIYMWYARNGGKTGTEFTRNQRFKLYRSGQFYNLQNDVLESHPLAENELTPQARQARQVLQAALARYSDARPERFATWNNTTVDD